MLAGLKVFSKVVTFHIEIIDLRLDEIRLPSPLMRNAVLTYSDRTITAVTAM